MTKENLQPTPGPSSVRRLHGFQPGILDPTQPSRLLRLHGAKLSFAAFDPLTACSQLTLGFAPNPLNAEPYRPKRVVIETAPSGECTWRFVPSAKRENGVVDEGSWPRVVNLCGEFVEMTQDQWDIYKLDPLYECFVPMPYHITTICVVPSKPPLLSLQPARKRRLSSRSPSPQRTMPPPVCGRHTFVQDESDSGDEDEVEAMVINDEQQPLPRRRAAAQERRERLESKRQERRGKIKEKIELFSQEDEMRSNVFPNGGTFDPRVQPPPRGTKTPEPMKRKAIGVFDTSWSPDSREMEELSVRLATNYIFSSNRKRTRISSPPGSRKFQQKKMERHKIKQQRRMEEEEARRRERDKRLLDEIMEEIPSAVPETDYTSEAPPHIPVSGVFDTQDDPSSQIHDDPFSQIQDDPFSQTQDDLFSQTQEIQADNLPNEEDSHRQAIEQSRLKLAELERDRPLWEEQAKQRRLREETEQRAYQAKMEDRREEARKKTEIESRARKERKEAETKRCEQEKNARQEKELRDQERRQRHQRWSFGPWTTQRALERYRVLSESFDVTRFTSELPLNIEDVPWPSLQSPKIFSVEDVSWSSVERFFETIKPHLRHQDFKILVEQSHRRFHPDRWRSRNLLKTVEDETIRGCMEVAANTVAQALTPMWRSLKDR